MKAKTAFDLDGVIIQDNLGLTRNWLAEIFCNCYFFYTRLGKFLYRFRQQTGRGYHWLSKRKARGEKIIIISATNKGHSPLVLEWLICHKIPYDKIFLKDKEDDIAEFKAKVISTRNCQFHLEDNYKVAKEIVEVLSAQYSKPARLRKWKRENETLYLIKINKNGSKF
jgi:hypothetical protein